MSYFLKDRNRHWFFCQTTNSFIEGWYLASEERCSKYIHPSNIFMSSRHTAVSCCSPFYEPKSQSEAAKWVYSPRWCRLHIFTLLAQMKYWCYGQLTLKKGHIKKCRPVTHFLHSKYVDLSAYMANIFSIYSLILLICFSSHLDIFYFEYLNLVF